MIFLVGSVEYTAYMYANTSVVKSYMHDSFK